MLREINSEYLLEGLILKLKLQYFGHLKQTANSLKNFLMLGKIEGRRRRTCQRMIWLDGIMDTMDMNLSKLWEMVRVFKILAAKSQVLNYILLCYGPFCDLTSLWGSC